MKVEFEIVCSEGENALHQAGIDLPLHNLIDFILEMAETGHFDPEELQDLAVAIRREFEDLQNSPHR